MRALLRIGGVFVALAVPLCAPLCATAAPLAPGELAGYLTRCAPAVHPQTQTALILGESSANPLAIHDNNSGRSYAPGSFPDASALATLLIAHDRQISGSGIDVGIGQINSRNFAARGVTTEQMLDACENLRVSSSMLSNAYHAHGSVESALQTYNSGSPHGAPAYVSLIRAQVATRYARAVLAQLALPIVQTAPMHAYARKERVSARGERRTSDSMHEKRVFVHRRPTTPDVFAFSSSAIETF